MCAYLQSKGHGSQAELARLLEVTQPCVSNWERGTARPKESMRVLLAKATGGAVPALAWMRVRERRQFERIGLTAEATKGETGR